MSFDLLFAEFPLIRSAGVTLRRIEPADLDAIYAIYSNATLFRYRPGRVRKNRATVANMISHFARDYGKRKIVYLGICPAGSDEVVGIAEIFDCDARVNMVTIGYTLNEAYWGRGLATQTVAALVDYLFAVVGVNRIQAFVMPANGRSGRVLLRNGFVREGTIRQGNFWAERGVVDLELYGLLRCEYGGRAPGVPGAQ
jgi:ribosomal-protein-alanine N-acetyltransferase